MLVWSQEYKKIEITFTIQIFMTYYHHLINRQAYGLFYITQQSMGENECGKSGCLFSLFEARNAAFEVQFFRTSFSHLIKDTGTIVCRAIQLRFFF